MTNIVIISGHFIIYSGTNGVAYKPNQQSDLDQFSDSFKAVIQLEGQISCLKSFLH